MIDWIKKIIGTKNEREIKRIRPYVGKINSLEQEYQTLADAELGAKTVEFRNRIAEATATLKQELEEALAAPPTAEADERQQNVGRSRRANICRCFQQDGSRG